MKRLFRQMPRWVEQGLPWLRKGSTTVLDQGLFAGSNFVLNVLLARWMLPEEYGAFAVAYGLFLLLGLLQSGFFNEPMLVFGSGRYLARLPQYLGVLLRGHVGFSLLGGVALGLGGAGCLLFGAEKLGVDLLALALAQPFILLLWLAREACYVRLKPQWSATGGLIYALLVLAGCFVLYQSAQLTAASALGLMALASLVAAAWLLFRLGVSPLARHEPALLREVAREHWIYGRWAASTGVLKWLPGNLPFLLLPIWVGLEGSGALKALLNLIMPMAHINGALTLLLLPTFVRARDGGRLGAHILTASGLLVLGTGLYWLALGVGGELLIGWLYDGQYTQYATLLWLIGALPVMASVVNVLGAGLRALERPDKVFWAYVGSTVAALTLSVTLIYWFGLAGAVAGLITQKGVEVVLMALLVYSIKRALTAAPPPPARASSEPAPAEVAG